MQHIIQLLPDAIANQIAAGEVVQRPASVLKELLENAVDAHASRIDVLIKDAGKSLIQVTDNGAGMSVGDARMAFERHATSKIRVQEDLAHIRTLGFRGEALASIAAVAQVKLRTRLQGEELGTEIDIEASEIKKQQPSACPPGSTFQVKNLFFNVPARRNFLKSNPVETRHLLNEFLRVAIPHPELHMTFVHNDTEVYTLPPQSLEERLIAIHSEELRGQLIEVEESTGYARFSGFIGKPSIYRKNRGEQYFFVNHRFIKSNYLNHAIAAAFENFIPKDTYPFYVVFIDIDPIHVDINIHPTKTEVKFDDEKTLYILLQGMIKRGLAETHQIPSDFSIPKENQGHNPIYQEIYQSPDISLPKNPQPQKGGLSRMPDKMGKPVTIKDWHDLYAPPKPPEKQASRENTPLIREEEAAESFFQSFHQRYILTARRGDLLIIDKQLAHQRILYEKFLKAKNKQKLPSQQLLFPQTVEFSPVNFEAIRMVEQVLAQLGFEIKEFGTNTLIVYGTPVGIMNTGVREILDQILEEVKQTEQTRIAEKLFSNVAKTVAQRCAVTSRQKLSILEMKNLVADLFACEVPGFSPSGKVIFRQIGAKELEEFFKS